MGELKANFAGTAGELVDQNLHSCVLEWGRRDLL